ncbi:MAG: hypothetical protein ABIP51_21200 [Bacteroidia bacterium]
MSEEQFKNDPGFNDWQKGQARGRVMAGVLVILAGAIYMYKLLGYFIPEWLFTWPMILIGAGFIAACKHGLKHPQWIILILIGSVFLAAHIFPEVTWVHYKIPIILFAVGLILIFKPKNRHHEYSRFDRHKHRHNHFSKNAVESTTDEYIFANNVFAGTDKVVFSKDFKGGEIKNTFGGCKINLMQAEIVTEARLTIKQQFGGVKLVIPINWVIKSDVDCVFAGIEDRRPLMNINDASQTKTLILSGHIFMSGIEIVSY